MQSILSIFKNRYFWILFGFIVLTTLTFVVGWWFDLTLVFYLISVIVLLIVAIIFLAVEFVRARRNAQQIEQSIKMQAEQQRAGSQPDRKAEIEELKERLEDAITTLKQSKLGRGRRGQNALHALPWYMFIGPPGAGKTTAIKNSGLNFPVGSEGIKGVGGTRNCDWFFSDQAILLDTAGRYMTEREDKEEWEAFLDMLKEHRSQKPINGVLVGISVEELVDAAADEIEWHANNIRRRISELVERLEVRFPIYLVFTKCDLLQGFVEFFGDLTRSEREQMWGATLTDEQRGRDDPKSVFKEEFDRLYDSLVDARSERLSRSMKREQRRKVYLFPLEFASAKENLALFVDQLFQRNPYQESPEFRGFYFTSGTQEGAPIDRVIHSIGREFDLDTGVVENSEPEQEKKSYFIQDLFTEVVIPDQYLVERTSGSVRRGRIRRWGAVAAAAVLLVLFGLGLLQAMFRSLDTLEEVQQSAQAAAEVEWGDRDLPDDLAHLDGLLAEVNELERAQEDPPFMQWGLYMGDDVLPAARGVYYSKLRPLMHRQFKALKRDLSASRSLSLNPERRSLLRAKLENYLLLADSSQALSSDQYRNQLTDYLRTALTTDSLTSAGSSAAFGEYAGRIEDHVAAYVHGLRRGHVDAFEVQSQLVQTLRRKVYRPPTISTIFRRLKRSGSNALSPIRLADVLGQSGGLSLFRGQPEVSGFFTKRGWETWVQDEITERAKAPGEGGLLGKPPEQLSEKLRDPEVVEEQLRSRYFEQYATAWTRFLREVEYASFGSLRETARALNTLGAQYDSPILYILAAVTNQTRFGGGALNEAQDQVQEEVSARAQGKVQSRTRTQGALDGATGEGSGSMHPVNRRFATLHRLKADEATSGNASRALVRGLNAIGRVGGVLDDMISDPSRSVDIAAGVLQSGGDLNSELDFVRNNLGQLDTDPRRNLFDAAILQAWSVILNEAQTQLNERWRTRVYQGYQENLAGTYPFAPSSQGAPLSAVRSFLHPKSGVLATFYRETLTPFVQEDGRTPRTWEGRGIEISSRTRRLLDRTERISENLFSTGALGMSFEIEPLLPERSDQAPDVDEVYIRVHGTELPYRMGFRTTKAFQWPNQRGSLLSVSTSEGKLNPVQYEGVWAWFRLLEEAEIEPRSANEYRLRWRFQEAGQYSVVVRYNLRTEVAQELIVSPRAFFGLTVPETID